MRIEYLTSETKAQVLEALENRSPAQFPEQEKAVAGILKRIREEGDAALFDITKQFDGVELDPESLYVSDAEIREAYDKVPERLLAVIRASRAKIERFHMKQKRNSWFDAEQEGILLGQRFTPLRRVGVYVPGGKAAYPSSVLMNIVPAKVAGVDQIIMATPPGRDGKVSPVTLVAAKEAGADAVIKAGGAQAIGAFAYGTQSVPKTDKIVGPGNIFVALAKKAVYGLVSIDSVAGPSEILVLADETADPHYVAADMLSQAEHDELASAMLVTTSEELARKVDQEIEGFLPKLSRREIIEKSLENNGHLLVADTMEDDLDAVNAIASEHLEIMTSDPHRDMLGVRNAGAIFLGPYSSEPLGDYFAGTNHILPTSGTARFFSALSVDDFVKKSSIVCYDEEALYRERNEIIDFAESEGLTAHANSIRVRFEGRE